MKNTDRPLPYRSYVLARIIRLRNKNQLTQKEVAEYLGIRQQTYSEYERGLSAMHMEEFLQLARLYNVSVDFICGATNLKHEFPKY